MLSFFAPSFSAVETFISWAFYILALATIGPWLIIFLYDFALYCFRSISWHMAPHGRPRPRAPSLAARPNGHVRFPLSVDLKGSICLDDASPEANEDEAKADMSDTERNDSVIGDSPTSRQRTTQARL